MLKVKRQLREISRGMVDLSLFNFVDVWENVHTLVVFWFLLFYLLNSVSNSTLFQNFNLEFHFQNINDFIFHLVPIFNFRSINKSTQNFIFQFLIYLKYYRKLSAGDKKNRPGYS